MDTSNIKSGQIFPSYRALCRAIGEPIKGGGSKITQMEGWKEKFEWKNIEGSNAIQIVEVFDYPKPKKLSRHEKKYQDSMSYCLLKYLSKYEPTPEEELEWQNFVQQQLKDNPEANEDDFVNPITLWSHKYCISKRALVLLLGLCTEKYYRCIGDYGQIYDELNECEEIGEDFRSKTHYALKVVGESPLYKELYKVASKKIDKLLDDLIKHLKNKGMVDIRKTFRVIAVNSGHEVEATLEQFNIITQVREETLTKFKCKTIGGVVVTNRYRDYINSVNKALNQHGLKQHTDAYKFTKIALFRDSAALYEDFFQDIESALSFTNQTMVQYLVEHLSNKFPKDKEQIVELVNLLISVEKK